MIDAETEETIRRVIYRAVRPTIESYPRHMDRDDLYQSAWVAALTALERYEPSRGTLATFLWERSKGGALDYARTLDPLPRTHRDMLKAAGWAETRLGTELGRRPETWEVAEAIGCREDILSDHELPLSLDLGGEDLEPRAEDPEQTAVLLRIEIERMLSTLDPRSSLAVRLFYLYGMGLPEIGRRLGVTGSRVSQLIKAGLTTIRKSMPGAESC